MRSRPSKIIDVDQQWKSRRNRRRLRKRRGEGQRNMRGLSAKIIKWLEDDDMNGRNSPCSVVSFSLSLNNRIEDTHGNSEWIRTTHIRNAAVNEHDRRTPLFTGRMLRRNDFLDDIHGSRQELLYENPPDQSRNPNISRPHIRERLEPPLLSNYRHLELAEFNVSTRQGPSDFNINPCLERPDILHRLEPCNISIYQRMEAPVAARSMEQIDIAPPEQLPFHQNQQENEPDPFRLDPRFIRDQYDGYNTDRFSRNHFSPPQRPRGFRRSLYYPPGYSSPPNEDPVKRQRTRWPWLKAAIINSENHPDYIDHDIRRDGVDYNVKRFARDTFSPPGQRNYEQSQYNRPQYFDHSGSNLNGSRSEMSLSSHEIKNYFEYRPEAYEMDYNNQSYRDDDRFDWSISQGEPYGSSVSPRRFYSSQHSGSSHLAHNGMIEIPQYRSQIEPPSSYWEGPRGRKNQFR